MCSRYLLIVTRMPWCGVCALNMARNYNRGIPNSNKVGSDNEVIHALAGTKIIIFMTCTKTLYGCLANQWTEKKLK